MMSDCFDLIHRLRGALPADEVIGYEVRDDEGGDFHLFVCAYHESEEYFNDDDDGVWAPITVKDTHNNYYQCDRMGCELGYWQELMEEKEA